MTDGYNTLLMASLEDEREIIGGVLMNRKFDGLEDLSGKHFFDRTYGQAFDIAVDLNNSDKPLDMFVVAEIIGGETVLSRLIDACQNTIGHNLSAYAKRVIERANAREAVRMAQEFIESMRESNGRDSDGAIQEFSRSLDEIAVSRSDNEATLNASELYNVGVDEFQKRNENGGGFVGLETGLKALDDKLMGLQGGSLYVMGGRPGMGKTAVSMTIAENISEKYADKGAVLVFNLEMSKEQLGLRTAAAVAEVSLGDLQRGYDTAEGDNYKRLSDSVERVGRRNMFVDVRADITVGKIKAKAQQIKNKYGLTLIVIDYLGLLEEPGKRFDSENARITFLTRQIKKIAKQLDVPILLLAQLSRKVEERLDKRPMMADLRDSGSIEQDADAIIFNYRDGYYSQKREDDMIEMIVAKQRMGEGGTAYGCFQGQYSRVIDVADSYVDYIHRIRGCNTAGSNKREA